MSSSPKALVAFGKMPPRWIWPRLWDWALPLGLAGFLCAWAPLSTALEFGGDEGFELMKGLLVSRGYPLYGEFWNDQPPLHTEILALLFRVFGPSALAGRLLSVAFATLLAGCLYAVVRRSSGRVAGTLAFLLLLGAPQFAVLSVSVMLELPAMALGMASVWALTRSLGGGGRRWLALSGALFGCALQIKLTAVIFGPALLVTWLSFGERLRSSAGLDGSTALSPGVPDSTARGAAMDAVVWCGAASLVFGIMAAAFYPPATWSVFLGSHFSSGTRAAVEAANYAQWKFSLRELDWELCMPSMLGLGLLFTRSRNRVVPALVLLLTAWGVHSWHRPYWSYYALHFSIALAWLGAVSLVEWFRLVWKLDVTRSWRAKTLGGASLLAWSFALSAVVTYVSFNGWEDLWRLRHALPAATDPTVLAFKARAERARWIFTDRRICAFWAGLPIPPELAVLPMKRIWSGQITAREVRNALERYRPELILIPQHWEKLFALPDYLEAHYALGGPGETERVFVRKQPPPQ